MGEEARVGARKARRAPMVGRRRLAVRVVRQFQIGRFWRVSLRLPPVLINPSAVHANAALSADTSSQVVVLVPDATDHARAARVPWAQR